QNELIKLQEEIVSKIKDKYEVGLCSVNDLLVEQRVLTLLNEERNTYIKNRDTLIDTIKVYLADSSDTVERNSYERITLLNGIPLEYSTEVIENRPDYLQEEANLKRIGIDIKVARRNFLPKFIIFGQIGLNAYHLDTLFNSASQMFSAGVLPSIDLFSGGRKLAILRLKKFQYDEAFNSYKKTIIDGIKDINLGIIKYKEAQENYKESSKRLELQDKTYSLVKDKLEIGSASDLDVLYAKQAYLMVKKDEVSNKMNSVISTIGLYKAAGGMDLYKINEDL
ncbi:TPA: TolC family protein, partial [Candidatus Avigastranaerophilus faecigallinarum]|nr:TolC family protein [Candidatus Avigastranaerophilus faecigallinarum]